MSIKNLQVHIGRFSQQVEEYMSYDISSHVESEPHDPCREIFNYEKKMLAPIVESSINEEKDARREVETNKKRNEDDSRSIARENKENKWKFVDKKSVLLNFKCYVRKKIEKKYKLKNKEKKEKQHAPFWEILKQLHSNDPSELAWEQFHSYAKFMEFLPKWRKKK